MGGKVPAEYFRKWRLAHPEYRQKQNERRNRRRAEHGRGDRQDEYRKSAERERQQRLMANGDNGGLLESCIVRQARKIVLTKRRPDRRTTLWDDRFEDLMGEVIVALCEGSDPYMAMREWTSRYWWRRYHLLPLFEEDAHGGRERPYP